MSGAHRAVGRDNGVPSGHISNPSALRARSPVAVLAFAGCLSSTYLALCQYHVLTTGRDPFFGTGSRTVLTSALSRALPVSDASIGATAYLFETVVELAGGGAAAHPPRAVAGSPSGSAGGSAASERSCPRRAKTYRRRR